MSVVASASPAPALTRPPIAPPLLLPYQRMFFADTSSVRWTEKSRRVGLSWSVAAECVIEAASGHNHVSMLAVTEENAKLFIMDVSYWAEALNIAAKAFDEELVAYDNGTPTTLRALTVRFPGSPKTIVALASNPRGFRGRGGWAVVDEAAHHEDLDEVMQACLPFVMWKGRIVGVSTHRGADSQFARICDAIRDGKRPYSLHRVTIATAIADGLYKRICLASKQLWSEQGEAAWLADLEATMDPDVAQEELHVNPTGAGVSYIPREIVRPCMVSDAPVLRYEQSDASMKLEEAERTAEVAEWIDAHLKPLLDALEASDEYTAFGFGLDWGRSADLTVLAPMGLRPNLTRRVPFLLELRNVSHSSQWQFLQHVLSRLPRLMFAKLDASGGGGFLSEQAWLEFGDSTVERVMFTQNTHRQIWGPLKSAFQERKLEIPSHIDVLSDLAMVRRINGIPKVPDVRNESASGRGTRHADSAVAIALAHAACTESEKLITRWNAFCV